ncbi:phage portal protein [Chromobacterium violaceum]|uniref:phage portal protein n=1 Tax=Chromobacterium violaceum TaxID=536 RepID=UPI0015FCADE5|nr:phage portal protein [Chromobacterium violaceum]MBA8734223.1 phage portal protein [Chromobacterium violaceum]
MNWLDNLIGTFMPERAVRRWQARQALGEIRAYEGAKRGRRTSGWITSGSSANAENQMALPTLRNRSRDLVRNNPWCKKALESWVGNVVGSGIRCNLASHKRLGKAFKRWANSRQCDADGHLNLYGLQALAARTMWESGEVLVRVRWRRPQDKLAIPLQFQVLEPDYLDSNKTEDLAGGGFIVAGVQFSAIGQVEGYWMFDRHPGEIGRLSRSLQSKLIPAKEVIHCFRKTRPGQVRGVPELAPVIMRARDLDDYEDAELTRKKVEACFSVFITSGDNGSSGVGSVEREEKPGGRMVEKIAPGLIKRLGLGESVTFGQPTPAGGYPDYTRDQRRALAAGGMVTYEMLTGDYSQVNYSSSRAGLLEFRRNAEGWQWLTFIPGLCEPMVELFLKAAALKNLGELEDDFELDFTTPRWDWVDPVKDMIGELLEVASGAKSLSELARRRGVDPQTMWQELSRDYEELAKLGIPLNLNNLITIGADALSAEDDPPDPADPESSKKTKPRKRGASHSRRKQHA